VLDAAGLGAHGLRAMRIRNCGLEWQEFQVGAEIHRIRYGLSPPRRDAAVGERLGDVEPPDAI
jgi:hypothetical protein